MMQFGLVSYQDQRDYASSLTFVEHYKGQGIVDETGKALLLAALKMSESIGKSVLICARLFFWGQLERSFVRIELAERINKQSFDAADVFEKQELLDCLGEDMLAGFIGTNFDFAKLNTRWNPADYSKELVESSSAYDETWIYIPPPTGFFSVIENIVLARFFCLLNKKRFKLDTRHNWWHYPILFTELLPYLDATSVAPDDSSAKYIMWDYLRQYFRYIGPQNFEFLRIFKAQEYKKVKRCLHSYISRCQVSERPNPEDCVVFVRGGDKIKLETIDAPFLFLREDVDFLRDSNTTIHVLSDDHKLADSFIQRLGLQSNANLTARDRSGYHLRNGHSVEDVNTIINNFLILANAKYSISCPSSNLVNSAHWSNRVLDDTFRPRSLPSLRYLYL